MPDNGNAGVADEVNVFLRRVEKDLGFIGQEIGSVLTDEDLRSAQDSALRFLKDNNDEKLPVAMLSLVLTLAVLISHLDKKIVARVKA